MIDYILTVVNCQIATKQYSGEIVTQIKQSHAQIGVEKESEKKSKKKKTTSVYKRNVCNGHGKQLRTSNELTNSKEDEEEEEEEDNEKKHTQIM